MNYSSDSGIKKLTSRTSLLRNTLWNVLGLILPIVVGVFSIPMLIEEIGNERFGVLALAWMVIGYFSIFDFGLGRALTKLIAEKLGRGECEGIPSLIWLAISISIVLSLIFFIALYFLSELIVFEWLNMSESIKSEAFSATRIVAFSIPFVVLTTIFRAVLEAHQQFKIINIIRLPLGLVTFLGPLLVLPISEDMGDIVMVLLGARVLGTYAYYHYMSKVVPEIKAGIIFDFSQVGGLLRYGGWMTVANVAAPLIMYVDRFVIGSGSSVESLTYYVAPYEMLAKIALIPMALIVVLFPTFSALIHADKSQVKELYTRSNRIVFFLVFPIVLFCVCFASEGLTYWLGSEVAKISAPILQWLAIGVLVNNFGKIPFVLIQAVGRPDILAFLYSLQLPIYIYIMWFSLDNYGLVGVAIIWTLRAALDSVVLSVMTIRLMPGLLGACFIESVKYLMATVLLLGVIQIDDEVVRVAVFLSTILVYVYSEWRYGLNKQDKSYILSKFKMFRRFI